MTTFAPLPAQDSPPMELPSMSPLGDSRAKTLAVPENSAAWAKGHDPASGPRLSDLLATYDRATSSWRTSQHCLLAQVSGEADGLAEFSETWPRSGMMRNGIAYQLHSLEPGTNGTAFGWLPTVLKNSGNGAPRDRYFGSITYRCNYAEGLRNGPDDPLYPQPDFAEQVMGFPTGWTELPPLATP
jgi:hypothetical protein